MPKPKAKTTGYMHRLNANRGYSGTRLTPDASGVKVDTGRHTHCNRVVIEDEVTDVRKDVECDTCNKNSPW